MAKRNVTLQLPDREPGEPDITEEQITEIKGHGHEIDTAYLRGLGRYQAAVLLRRIAEKERELAWSLIDAPRKRRKKLAWFLVVLIAIAIALMLPYCTH